MSFLRELAAISTVKILRTDANSCIKQKLCMNDRQTATAENYDMTIGGDINNWEMLQIYRMRIICEFYFSLERGF